MRRPADRLILDREISWEEQIVVCLVVIVKLERPWRIFHRDDNWRSPAETSDRFPGQVFRGGGAYTPVFPPAWIKQGPNASAVELWMVWTQCCPGTRHGYNITPVAHYAFAAQRLCVVGASSSTGVGGAAGKV